MNKKIRNRLTARDRAAVTRAATAATAAFKASNTEAATAFANALCALARDVFQPRQISKRSNTNTERKADT
jgi:hypothetical protein